MDDTGSPLQLDVTASLIEDYTQPVVQSMQPTSSSHEDLHEKFRVAQHIAENENERAASTINTNDTSLSIAEHYPESCMSPESDLQDTDDDSDFGSFDDAEIEEAVPASPPSTQEYSPLFDKKVMSGLDSFSKALGLALSSWGGDNICDMPTTDALLSGRAQEIYSELSSIPHLKPSNWVRSKLRRDLLLRLGVPIDLDELAAGHPQPTDLLKEPVAAEIQNIDWEGLVIPSLLQLNINDEQRNEYAANTSHTLEKITTDNLSNLSRQFLEEQISDEGLQAKLDQLTLNFKTLVSLASVWSKRLDELKSDHATFEAVVQNTTGYKQKLKREELRGQLKRRGTKRNSRLW